MYDTMVDPVAPTRESSTPKSLTVMASNKDIPKKQAYHEKYIGKSDSINAYKLTQRSDDKA